MSFGGYLAPGSMTPENMLSRPKPLCLQVCQSLPMPEVIDIILLTCVYISRM